MAGLDNLLQALTEHNMEALLLEPGKRPRMRQNGTEKEVTPGALDAATLEGLLVQVAPEGAIRREPAIDTAEFVYEIGSAGFHFCCKRSEAGWGAEAAVVAPEGPAVEAAPSLAALGEAAGVEAAEPASAAVADAVPSGSASKPSDPEPAAPAAAAVATAPAPVGEAQPRVPSGGGEQLIGSVDEVLADLLERDASDLHLSSGQEVRMRIHGDLLPAPEWKVPTAEHLEQLLFKIIPQRNLDDFKERNDTDFGYEIPGQARFRVNYYRDRQGIGAVLRQIPMTVPSFEELRLPGVLRRVTRLAKGLILATGPTGSGKSTTLASILNTVNEAREDHIITIEDPIEFVHPSKKCLVHQREVGVHTQSFASALRAGLREDPDVVLVGEMRDLETAAIAIETAETGHLVFGTLHTTTATGTVERLINQFPGDRQPQIRLMLAECLFCVISQTLLKRKAGGRVAAFEILINTPAVANLIRENKTFQIASMMQTGKKEGMLMMNDTLLELVEKDIVSTSQAYLKSPEKEDLVAKFKAAGIELDLTKA